MYSREINFEKTIEGAFHALIPIVMVLLEGGRSSIKTLCEAVWANTPVVVVKVRSPRSSRWTMFFYSLPWQGLRPCGWSCCWITGVSWSRCYRYGSILRWTGRAETSTSTRFCCSVVGACRSSECNVRLYRCISYDVEREVTFSFNRARVHNPWVDEIHDALCGALNERRHLLTIFDFDSEQYHGRLEEAILAAVFDGLFASPHCTNRWSCILLFLAAKFSHQSNEQYRSTAELRLALVDLLAWRIEPGERESTTLLFRLGTMFSMLVGPFSRTQISPSGV